MMKEARPMSHRKILVGLSLSAVMGLSVAYAQNKPAAPGGAGGAPAADAKPTCKLHGKACCDPASEAHLPKEAVYKAWFPLVGDWLDEKQLQRNHREALPLDLADQLVDLALVQQHLPRPLRSRRG